jgi:DNA repair protein RadC
MARKKAPELTFQQHIADSLVREHKYGALEQAEITDNEHFIAEDHLWAFLKATQADTLKKLKHALSDRASAVIVAHNHPSGGVEPSQSDVNITAQIKAAGEIVGIELLDHIIFNRTGYFSFLEAGRL